MTVTAAMEAAMIKRYHGSRYFVSNRAEMMAMMEEHGVCIWPSLLDKEECLSMQTGALRWLEFATARWEVPFDRNDPETWKGFFKLLPMHSMLLQHWGVGHSSWVWDVRSNPKVIEVFALLWQTADTDLLTSFDGASIHLPHETTRRGYYRGNTWLHTDQSYERPAFECAQSWVTARTVRPGDATLAFIPGSHRRHKEFAAAFPKAVQKGDWYKLTGEQQAWYGNDVHFIECPAGSMVMWDSRLIHSGSEAVRSRARPNTRIVAYVCMVPRYLASKKTLLKRTTTFEARRMTTHWPHRVRLFGKLPRTYGNPVPVVQYEPLPLLSPLQRRLVGYSS
jgi:hypothetical protein